MNQNVIRGLLGLGIVIIGLIIGAGILAEQPSETKNISGIQVFTTASDLAAYLDSMPQAESGYTTGVTGVMDGNSLFVAQEAAMDSAMTAVPTSVPALGHCRHGKAVPPEMVYGTLALPCGDNSDKRYSGNLLPVPDMMIE